MGKKFKWNNAYANAGVGAAWAGDRDQKQVWKYGAPFDPQAWNRMEKDKAYDKEKYSAGQAAALRAGAQQFLADISRNRRASHLKNYRPIEDDLVSQVRLGINPDYDAIRTEASDDVGQGYGIQAGINQRNAARYGIDPSRLDDPSLARETELGRTAAQAYAANSAVDNARTRAESLNAQRGQQVLALGAGQAELAGAEYATGTGALADLWDYDAMMRGRRTQDQIQGDKAGGQAIGNLVGGIFGGGGAKDGGQVGTDTLAMGGRPGNTIRLRNQYNEYRTEMAGRADTPKDWPAWLEDQGYTLDKDNLIRPKYVNGGAVGYGIGGPRMGITGINGRAVIPERHGGGRVIDGYSKRVDLETSDYIMPKDVVDAVGVEYFDRMVEENMPRHYAGGGLIYPGRGAANFVGGFTQGMRDAEDLADRRTRREAYKEDREYLRSNRAREEAAYRQKAELQDATSRFIASDGQDIESLLNLYNRHGSGYRLGFERNEAGGYQLSTTRPDGSTEVREMEPEDIRNFGMRMVRGLHDSAGWLKSQEPMRVGKSIVQREPDGTYRELYQEPGADWAATGFGAGLYNKRTGEMKPGLDPDALRRARSAGGPKAVRYPPRTMILDAQDMLESDPDLANLSEEDRKALSVNVASRAQALLTEQPGIDASEAIAQALDEERTNVTSGEKRERFGFDWLARDVAPTYQDRRRVPVTTPAEQALKAKMNAKTNPRAPAAPSPTEPTAVNPKTGERIVYRNGQWQPLR